MLQLADDCDSLGTNLPSTGAQRKKRRLPLFVNVARAEATRFQIFAGRDKQDTVVLAARLSLQGVAMTCETEIR